MNISDQLTPEEIAMTLRVLRERRAFLSQLIEMQKSQRRRGLTGAPAEISRLETERTVLENIIRKLWSET